MTNIPSQVFNISLHCVILFTFLTIFYWNIIINEEINSINRLLKVNVIDNVENILKKNRKSFKLNNKILKPLKNKILNPLNESIHGDDITQDKLYYLNHDKFLSININILLLLYIVFIFILYYLVKQNYNINYKEIIIENIILILCVGTIEIIFFFTIAKQFVPLSDVEINDTMIDIINSLDIINRKPHSDVPKGFIGGQTQDETKGFIGGQTQDEPIGFIGGQTQDEPIGFIGGQTYDN